MDIRVGLAGLGVHGARYASHLLQGDVPGLRLVAVCRRDVEAGERFAEQHRLRFVADPCEIVTLSEVDAVIAVLPPDLHASIALAALEAGRPILVEKPLAHSAAAARRVAARAERSGVPLMVAQTLRFDPVVEALKREVTSLGALRIVSINQRFEPAKRPWIDELGPGGMILNTGVHGFDLMRYLTGLEPAAVWAECGRALTARTEDQFTVMVRLEPGGVLAVMDNARTTASRSGRIEIVGESGQIWGDHVFRTLQRVRGREVEELGPIPAMPTIPRTLGHFARCIREGTEPPVSAADGAAAVAMVDAALESARSGARVALD